ncbi:hypothetical protein E1200_19730 [Actinomadura sp. GC306]|uniref:dynamin family protein n=1 Tax=Actinomadura sp. GC306 TaxID=2530367 RepID=UPI00104C3BE1|nr:dynamin family protein [Actinomadura sp. GC306]TDC64754.1 hypothetical protein E1200_19730 [Actinomadura sp. GC306]
MTNGRDGRMRGFEAVRSDVLDVLERLRSLARQQKADAGGERLADAEHRLRDGRLTVLVCGEFKRGKSTLLNALLEEDPELFPTGTTYATNVTTTVFWGAPELITAVMAVKEADPEQAKDKKGKGGKTKGKKGKAEGERAEDGETEPTVQVFERTIPRREDIGRYVTESGNPGNEQRVIGLRIRTANPRLESGLAFIDTPGVGGVFDEHTAATLGVVPAAHAVLFVTDTTQPLTASELRFLEYVVRAAEIGDDPDALLGVVTRVDQVTDPGEYVAALRARLAELTGRPDPVVVPVSSLAKLRHMTGGGETDLRVSNFSELERVLWAALGRRRARLLLGDALDEARAVAEGMLRPLEAAQEALADQSAERRAELRAKAQEARDRLAELQNASFWRGQLEQEFAMVRRGLDEYGASELDDVWDKFEKEYLHDSELLKNPEKLTERLAADATLVASRVVAEAQSASAKALDAFVRRHGMPLVGRSFEAAIRLPHHHGDVAGAGERPPGAWLRVARDMAVGAGVGATAGALLGPVGAAVGSVVGLVAGTVSGVRRLVRNVKAVQRQALRKELAPVRRKQMSRLKSATAELMADHIRAATTELSVRIRQERESAQAALDRLEAAEKVVRGDLERERAVLVRETEPLRTLLASVDRLSAEASLLGSAGAPAPDARPSTSPSAGPSAGGARPDGDWADE